MDEEFDTVEYQGEIIKLSRSYADFKAYRDDPDNLPERAIPHVTRLVTEAPVPEAFATREAADHFMYGLMFPGYGLALHKIQGPLALYSLELPRTNRERWIAVISRGNEWRVIDDFVWSSACGDIGRAESDSRSIRYFDDVGNVLREKMSANH